MAKKVKERQEVVRLLGEVFREYGYHGTSLGIIQQKTGLGRGSLYHFFPGGKEDMAKAVLSDIETWFEAHIFKPLLFADDPKLAVEEMLKNVTQYFHSGNRVCLVGAFALNDPEDHFTKHVATYFEKWIDALTHALKQLRLEDAHAIALDLVGGIQGSIILTRAQKDSLAFTGLIRRFQNRYLK